MLPYLINAKNIRTMEELDITPSNYSIITEFTGSNPIKADLFSQSIYNRDGALFQSSKGQVRNIVLSVYVFKDVEAWREKLVNLFLTGEWVELAFKHNNITRTIKGVVESFSVNIFGEHTKAKQIHQISILCYEPYFAGEQLKYNLANNVIDIPYSGTAEAGFAINIDLNGVSFEDTVGAGVNHCFRFEVSDQIKTLEFEGWLYLPEAQNPFKSFEVNTAEKKATLIKTDGTIVDALQYWVKTSEWFTLKALEKSKMQVTVYKMKFGTGTEWVALNANKTLTVTPLYISL